MHEMDHIKGNLFTDQVSKMALTAAREKRKKYMRRIKRQVQEHVKVTV
jgi:peptide deformylase